MSGTTTPTQALSTKNKVLNNLSFREYRPVKLRRPCETNITWPYTALKPESETTEINVFALGKCEHIEKDKECLTGWCYAISENKAILMEAKYRKECKEYDELAEQLEAQRRRRSVDFMVERQCTEQEAQEEAREIARAKEVEGFEKARTEFGLSIEPLAEGSAQAEASGTTERGRDSEDFEDLRFRTPVQVRKFL